MNLGRIFAHAIVRRVAFVLVALVFAWLGIGKASAHVGGGHESKQVAYEHCEAYLATKTPVYGHRCADAPAGTLAVDYQTSNQAQTSWGMSSRFYYSVECPVNFIWNATTKTCDPANCAAKPALSGGYIVVSGPSASWPVSACKSQCMYYIPDGATTETYWTIDGVTYLSVAGWTPSGATCSTDTEQTTPPPDSDDDGVSDANDDFPTNPNETNDNDGDGTGDNADVDDDDATNDDDDGTGNETDNAASGGGDCVAAPQCTGDGIQCNQLYQQWKMRCNLEGNKISEGGSCVAPYACSGDPVLCAQLNEARLARCSLERDDVGAGTGPDYSLPDKAVGTGDDGTDPHPDVDGLFESETLANLVEEGGDDTGFGLPRSCPMATWPTLTFRGSAVTMPWGNVCDALQIIAALMLIAGHIQWAYIVGRIGS